jgi:hypothetical protein
VKTYTIKLEETEGEHHQETIFPTVDALADYMKAQEENAKDTLAGDGGAHEAPAAGTDPAATGEKPSGEGPSEPPAIPPATA